MRTPISSTLFNKQVLTRLLVTLLVVALYRVGTTIPLPGVDYNLVSAIESGAQAGGALSLLNLFSGGALSQAAIFSLGVMPYITASIFMQLLEGSIPSLKALKKQGESGRRRLAQLTRTIAVSVALLQSYGIIVLLQSGTFSGEGTNLLPNLTLPGTILVMMTLLGSFLLLIWMGEMISQYGLGNGLSVLILASLLAPLPSQGIGVLSSAGPFALTMLILVSVVGVIGVVAFSLAVRKLPITHSLSGRRSTKTTSAYLPLKVLHAGLVPVIFTGAILTLLTSVAVLLPDTGTLGQIGAYLQAGLSDQTSILYLVVFSVLIVFFAYFYTAVTFKPIDVAEDLQQRGSFLPGVRPGEDTMYALAWVVSRLTIGGGALLLLVALLPSFADMLFGVQQFPLGGVALLIAVSATLDTAKQLRVRALLNDYDRVIDHATKPLVHP